MGGNYRAAMAELFLGGKVDPYGAHYQIVRCQRCGLTGVNGFVTVESDPIEVP